MTADVQRYVLERAWVDGTVHDDVAVEVTDGVVTRVALAPLVGDSPRFHRVAPRWKRNDPRPTGDRATPIPGLTLPGFRNTHSHAFHRALRGRTQRGTGSFWTWREEMYGLSAVLDPDGYHELAVATYTEMLAAGWTSVTEFHYLHHQPDGTPYDDPNAMGHALVAAAREVGIRLTVVDACYLAGGIGEPLSPAQRRFADIDVDAWAARMQAIDHDRVGGAIHSVRAVPRAALAGVVEASAGRELHVHLSEQPAENEACRASYGCTPTQLLHDAGALGPHTTAVHATHLTDGDIALLAGADCEVSLCPTTERDLADGIGPARALADAGVRLSLGSDSQAVIDPFEEMRATEADERLATGVRGRFGAAELLRAASGGSGIAVGEPADLVTLATRTPRTAGTGADEHTAVYAATGADVVRVMAAGRLVLGDDRTDPHTAETQRTELGSRLEAVLTRLHRRAEERRR